MYLKNIALTNFKNHVQTSLSFNEKVNCIVGKNGSGKTNLLDAIHYLSFCKSYFSHQDVYTLRFNSDFFAIHGEFVSNKLNTKVSCTFKNGHKTMKANNKEYERFSDHIGLFPLIMISPYDNDIINNGSDLRRRFFDIIISQFDKEYLHQLISYQKILQQRNMLLKQIESHEQYDTSLVSIYNTQLIPAGSYIFEKRKSYIESILPDLNKYYDFLSSGNEHVDIQYNTQLATTSFDNGIKNSWNQDLKFGYSNFGIHKDDFLFFINKNSLKKYGSQGQQKSFALALKLAQFDYIVKQKGIKPILLLDDIFDKLDTLRINQLLQLVGDKHFEQVFITDTDSERIEEILKQHEIDNHLFRIEEITALSEDRIASELQKTN